MTRKGLILLLVIIGFVVGCSNNATPLVTLEENIERFENGSILKDAQITTEFFLSTGQLNRTPKIEELLDASFIKLVKGN